MGIQFTSFIADHGDLQQVPDLKLSDQLDHLGVRFGLGEHKFPELRPGERSLLVEHHSPQIVFQRELALLVGGEVEPMPILHLGPLHFEERRRPFTGMMIPPVGEQNTADIQKQRRDRDQSFHLASVNPVCYLCPFVPRARSMAQDLGLRR